MFESSFVEEFGIFDDLGSKKKSRTRNFKTNRTDEGK